MLIQNWRQAWRWWSVRVSALGALLTALLLAAPDLAIALWQALPPELAALLPRHAELLVPLGLQLAAAIARVIRQRGQGDA